MKKILLSLFAAALSVATVFAQAPEKMNYQGVARDNSGNVLPNQSVGLQIKLRSGSSGGTVVYQETHAASTNAFGLFNVQIGGGSVESGTFASIAWGTTTYYVEVLMDASGGTSYTSMGTQQLVSVPYALNAKSAANVSGTTNYVSKFTSGTTLGNSLLFDNGATVGIGTTSAGYNKLSVYGAASSAASGPHQSFFVGSDPNPTMQLMNWGLDEQALMFSSYLTTTNDWQSSSVDGNFMIHKLGNRLNFEYASGVAPGGSIGWNNGMVLTSTGNVGIGTTIPNSQLHVLTTAADGSAAAVFGRCNHIGNVDADGLRGENTVAGWYGYGVSGIGGWYGGSFDATVAGTGSRYGVAGYAGGTSSASYGVYGSASGSGTNYAGYFSGDVYSSGSYLPSDANLKSNVKQYDNALAMISNIPVKSYTYKNNGIYGKMSLPQGNQVGIMAQDLETVYPQLVKHAYFEDTQSYHKGLVSKENMESIDYKAVNYTGLVPVLVKAMQEQNQVIEELKARIEKLEAK